MWYVGIDWADQHHDVVVIDEHGKQVDKKRVEHSAEGLADLVEFLKGIGDVRQHADHVACIIETNKGPVDYCLVGSGSAGLPGQSQNPGEMAQALGSQDRCH